MKRFVAFVLIPLALFALEKVNLIKDGGFERNSEVWLECAGGDKVEDSAVANRHTSEKKFAGEYSAFCDTRKMPYNPWVAYEDSALIIQGFPFSKPVIDLDSLTLEYSVIPSGSDTSSMSTAFIAFYLNAGKEPYWLAGYFLHLKGQAAIFIPPWKLLRMINYPTDELWYSLSFAAGKDLDSVGLGDFKVDSFYVLSWGGYFPPWRGQKIYWDDIRLTGYADYDVGVKGILSRDSISNAYTPVVHIKNFGRKPADSFFVIAQIEGGSGTVYADTLSWSLTADTEDTISFKEFKPSDALDYTLTVSTFMTPDESDEDDAMSKTLYGSGILEQPIPAGLPFEVSSFAPSPWVSYSIPAGQQGTISLFDPTGRRIESHKVIGSGKVTMNSALSSGVYFIKLETFRTTITRKTVVLR